ncbi:MAG TPA: aldehyde dehydrogenase family protein [Pyrinomonadaceae bacterium]|nr:aldehyde dehydrogenase family protein [Pyrinomonadaceae bacterium]
MSGENNIKPLLIGGSWRETGETFEARSPFSNELLARICKAGEREVEEATAAAVVAASEMLALSRFEVAEGLRKIAKGIGKRGEEFARTIALEAAKPLKLARGEVERAVSTFEMAAAEAGSFTGEVVPVDAQALGRGRFAWTERIPRGVIFGITPFNFPINLVAHKVAPALASKNAIIVKPSPRTPLTAALLGEVFLESGLPKGTLQIVSMDVELIENALKDERIGMISFTGSAEVGWQLRAKAPKKAVSLELGGNAPVIVDETADLELSLERSVMGAFAYAGQICISAQRFLVHEKIFDDWTAEFVSRAGKLRTGDPLDEATELSVMIDEAAAKRAESWVREAVDNGAKLLCGGKRSGSLLLATVLTDTQPEMRVVSEEIFAPVAVIEKFADFGSALDSANQTKYGLQAGVFTRDLGRAREAAQRLEFGGVLINDVPTFRVDNMPYGGIKLSGFGREGVRYAMEEMTEIKLIIINS